MKKKKERKKETAAPSESLLEGLVDGGVGVQGGGAVVHELGRVVRYAGAEVAAVRGVGQAGHHRHHLGDLLLQLRDLLLPLVDLAWGSRERRDHIVMHNMDI